MARLEVCVDTIEGAVIAARSGAHRIELCAALSEGGLTPSVGLMQAAAKLDIPVYTMIRPRAGDFCYSRAELSLMEADIEACLAAGCDGIALGVLLPNAELDQRALAKLLRVSPLPATLHRAIDCVVDPMAALEQAIELGFERILTSGGQPSALEGLLQIERLVVQAAGRISIMPGAGVREENAARIIRATGVQEVHSSCASPNVSRHALLPNDIGHKTTDPLRIANILAEIVSL